MKRFYLLAVAFAVVLGCREQTYSDRLVIIARQPMVHAKLISWVDSTMKADLRIGGGLLRYVGPRPGRYLITRDCDWEALGLVGDRWSAKLLCDSDETPLAVYFDEDKRSGIVVSLHGAFGLNDGDLVHISDRVAVHTSSD